MTISSLKSLQERIRAATGPDRDLDCEIANWHGWRCDNDYNYTPSGAMTLDEPPLYTTYPEGLGACVGLMNEVAQGLNAHISIHREWCRVILTREDGAGKTLHEMVVSSPERTDTNVCLALIDAILSAVLAREEAREGVK